MALSIDADLHRGLVALSRATGSSLFMVLQAGLAGLLTRLGAGTDIALGSPIAGRTDAALDELVGFFVNTLVLRTDTSGHPRFDELIGRVRTQNLAAYAHAELPFERLVEVLNPARSLSRHPLFQVMLAFEAADGTGAELTLPGLHVEPQAVAASTSKFDLSVALAEQRTATGEPAGISGVLEYASDLFDRGTVEALGQRLLRLLSSAVADASRPLGSLAILDADERGTILEGFNAAGRVAAAQALRPPPRCLRCLRRRLLRTPDAVAVVFEDRELSYAALDAHANRLANHLRSLGVGPDVLVGCVRGAFGRAGGGASGGAEGRGRLCAAGARASGGPADRHGRGCGAWGGADAARAGAAACSACGHTLRAARRGRLERHSAQQCRPAGCISARLEPGLHDLHVGLDRDAEGCGEHACGAAQPSGLDAGRLWARR